MKLSDIPLDTETIQTDQLNIASKTRSNLFAWSGQFSPQLVNALIETYSRKGDFVIDPFMGSGTVLIEAARNGLRAFGTEINPAAYMMAQTYSMVNIVHEERIAVLSAMDRLLTPLDSTPNLFCPRDLAAGYEPKQLLLTAYRDEPSRLVRHLLETLIVTCDFYGDVTASTVWANWARLRSTVKGLPFSDQPIGMEIADARSLPLHDNCVDLVVTSPPYINVFNYHQQYRASVEALGWNLLDVAPSEIGSNRKHRGNRLLTVIQYCLDITQVLLELRRLLKRDGRIIFVVGRESNVRKTRFFNGDIVSQLGTLAAGLRAEVRQERAFTNRYGQRIVEDIIHFRRASDGIPMTSPYIIAEHALNAALTYAPEETMGDLMSAIEAIHNVRPSRYYGKDTIRHETTHSAP